MTLDLNKVDKATMKKAISYLQKALGDIKETNMPYHRKQFWNHIVGYLNDNKSLID